MAAVVFLPWTSSTEKKDDTNFNKVVILKLTEQVRLNAVRRVRFALNL